MRLHIFAFLSLAVASAASASLQVTLRLGSETTVPGLSSGIWLDVRNNGDAPARIPRFAALQVRTESGQEFIAAGGGLGHIEPDFDEQVGPRLAIEPFAGRSPILAPNETKTSILHQGFGDPWMCDSRLETPGTYRLRLVLDERIMGLKLDGLSRVLDQEGLVSPVVSNEVTLTVKEPEGDDATVWNMRVRRSGGTCRWSFIGLDDHILERYPKSAYARFLYPMDYERQSKEVQIQHLERSIAANPDHPRAEERRVELAHIYVGRAYRHVDAQQLQLALADLQKGRELLLGVVRRRFNPNAMQQAVEELQSWAAPRDSFIDYYNRIHSPSRIQAFLDCIQPLADGRYEAWLFYDNSGMETRQIPVGDNNKITPPPFDRAQPTTFSRGLGWYFKVTSDGSDLTWHIDGTNLKISAKKLVGPPAYPDGEWEYWKEAVERERPKTIYRCQPDFQPDPEKLHTTALQGIEQ